MILVAAGGSPFVGTAKELQEHGIDLQVFPDSAVALIAVGEEHPDAVVLPATPGGSLAKICRAVTGWTSTAVIVAFPADGDATEAYEALDNGATALLTMPVTTSHLSGALANLGMGILETVPVHGPLWLDPSERLFGYGDRSVPLPLQEYRLLEVLLRRAPEPVGATELAAALDHEPSAAEAVGTVRAVVRRVRRRIQPLLGVPAEDVLSTVRGSGYLICADALAETRAVPTPG